MVLSSLNRTSKLASASIIFESTAMSCRSLALSVRTNGFNSQTSASNEIMLWVGPQPSLAILLIVHRYNSMPQLYFSHDHDHVTHQ
jgi:hypothetical protein